jgi:signal transduction histidine kinase
MKELIDPDLKQKKTKKITPVSLVSSVSFSVSFLLSVLIVAWLSYQTVEREVKAIFLEQLSMSLPRSVKMFKIWESDMKAKAKALTSTSGIRKHSLELRKVYDSSKDETGMGFNKEKLKVLRSDLNSTLKNFGFMGFVLLDETGFSFAASEDAAMGHRKIMDRLGKRFIDLAFLGNTVITLPFKSEVEIPDGRGNLRSDWPNLLIATPVLSLEGEFIGVLGLRLRPESVFSHIFEIERAGRTGEIYAFNESGITISKSRFEEQLKVMGLIPDKLETPAILNLSIRDPGVNLTNKGRIQPSSNKKPFTRMALSALAGENGYDLDGYRDYRGVKVVGAWAWLPEFGFGIASEMDYEEAFSFLHKLEVWFYILFCFLLAASIRALYMSWQREKAHASMMQAKEDAEKANAAKTDFLARMSHELRTPLNAILGFAQLLGMNSEKNLSEVQKDNVEHVLRGGNHLLLLVNDVLDLSRIETGEFSVKIESLEFGPLLDEALRLIQPLAKSNEIKIECLTPKENHLRVMVDHTRIVQVLINLLSNAIKYNRKNGSVTISQEKNQEDRVRISIADTGYGIPKEKQSEIFEPFSRLNVDKGTADGVGIGLSITQKLIDLMGGSISLESEVDKGSHFTIELQLAKP